MTTATYKGYNISVKHEPKLHPDYAYVAYINDVPGGRNTQGTVLKIRLCNV